MLKSGIILHVRVFPYMYCSWRSEGGIRIPWLGLQTATWVLLKAEPSPQPHPTILPTMFILEL